MIKLIAFFLILSSYTIKNNKDEYYIIAIQNRALSMIKKRYLTEQDRISSKDEVELQGDSFLSFVHSSGKVFEFQGPLSVRMKELKTLEGNHISYTEVQMLHKTEPTLQLATRDLNSEIALIYPFIGPQSYWNESILCVEWSIPNSFDNQYVVNFFDYTDNFLLEDTVVTNFYNVDLRNIWQLTQSRTVYFNIRSSVKPFIKSPNYFLKFSPSEEIVRNCIQKMPSESVLIGLAFEQKNQLDYALINFNKAVNDSGGSESFRKLLHNFKARNSL